MNLSNTREAWLLRATESMRCGLFFDQGHIIPEVKISVGFPGGGSARKRIGEYWLKEACRDGIPQIFISPTLEDPLKMLDVLVHELCHSIVPKAGHGPLFRKVALSVGLVGPMTSTVAGDSLKAELQRLVQELGPLPHSGINLGLGRKKQSTRLVKIQCTSCGYTCRTTLKWLGPGTPLCPCNLKPMELSL
jgi:hypothetical protein